MNNKEGLGELSRRLFERLDFPRKQMLQALDPTSQSRFLVGHRDKHLRHKMNGIMGSIREEFRNPVAWIFLALFVFAEYWNFQKGEDIDKLCELTGPHNATVGDLLTDRDRLDAICVAHEDDTDFYNFEKR